MQTVQVEVSHGGHTQWCWSFRQHGQLTLRVQVWDHAALPGQVNSLVRHDPQSHEGSCPDLILSLRSILPCLFSWKHGKLQLRQYGGAEVEWQLV